MPSLGETLREARQAKGASLEDVEAFTHIRVHFVEALEQEHFDAFPSPVYVRGFLRNYALYLGLDPREVLSQYSPEEGHVLPGPQMLAEPLVASPWLRPARLGIGIFFIVLLVAFGLWLSRQENRARLQLPSGLGFLANLSVSTSPTSSPTASAVPLLGESIPDVTRTPLTRTPTATPVLLPSLTPTPTPGVSINVAVVVSDTSWVEVVVDGNDVFAKTMNPGETGRWEAGKQLSLKIGNGGGVVVTVNGQRIGLLGRSGEVVSRQWTLNPEGKLIEGIPTPVVKYTQTPEATTPKPALPEVTATGTPTG